nr:unnamed protein product [Callosobruchus chinensis]
MSTAAAAGMQAALLIREKQRLRRKKFRKGRADLPSHVATRDIGPFPQYPPGFMLDLAVYNISDHLQIKIEENIMKKN